MERRAILKNQKGERLVGVFNIPKGKGPFPVVVICHGFKGYKEQGSLLSLARELAKVGITAFRFDFTQGVGESAGRLENISFRQEVREVKSAVDYVAGRSFIDKKRIGLAGASLGGQAVLTYAPTDRRIKVLADMAGVVLRGGKYSNLDREAESQLAEAKKTGYFTIFSRRNKKQYRIRISFYFELQREYTPNYIKKIKIPTLIIQGRSDESVGLIHSRLAYRLLRGKKKLVIVPGVPHTWRLPKHYQKMNPHIVAWFKKYL